MKLNLSEKDVVLYICKLSIYVHALFFAILKVNAILLKFMYWKQPPSLESYLGFFLDFCGMHISIAVVNIDILYFGRLFLNDVYWISNKVILQQKWRKRQKAIHRSLQKLGQWNRRNTNQAKLRWRYFGV